MKTANEMIKILENRIKTNYNILEKYNKKYEETGKESWYQLAAQVNEKIILLEQLHKEFTE